jgi:hypothetical protein
VSQAGVAERNSNAVTCREARLPLALDYFENPDMLSNARGAS